MARLLVADYGREDLLALGSPLVDTLRTWGHEVVEAEQSLDVLQHASRAHPDAILGFDHRVGHSLLLLYDAKAPHSQKSKEFKGLGHYPTNIPVRLFLYHNKIYYLYNYLIFLLFL